MSATAMGMALSVVGVSPRAKIVLIAICNCASEYTFQGYPSRKDLARVADCSVDTIDRCIRELVDLALLEKQGRERDDGRGLTSNLYRVFPDHDPSRRFTASGSRTIASTLAVEMRPPSPQANAATLAAYGAAPKEPLSEPLVLSSYPPTKAMIDALCERAGQACNLTAGGVHHGGDLIRFLRAGCTWEDIEFATDMLAASFQRRGKRFSTWKLLEEHVLEIRDRRLAGVGTLPRIEQRRASGRASMSAIIDRVFAEEEAKRDKTL